MSQHGGGIASRGRSRPPVAAGGRWESLDAIKAVALLWIFVLHWAERLFGGWHIANPRNTWPPLDERFAQLLPVSGHGIWDLPLSLLLGIARAGDQGVQLFLIVSGFGLTWALLRRGATPSWGTFYRRRLSRILPEYWIAHLLLLAAALAAGRAIQADVEFLFSLLGVRVTPDLLYSMTPAWWYIGLILQLYAVYPLLWQLLRTLGWVRFLVVVLAGSLAIRTIGLWVFADLVPQWGYLDAWARGAVFITRLPEFALGMALAAWARAEPDHWMRRLTSLRMLVLAAVGYACAIALSAFLLGNGIAIFLLGACAFILLLALFERVRSAPRPAGTAAVPGTVRPAVMRGVRWLSDHTYALFLMHYLVIAALIPRGARLDAQIALRTVIAILGTVLAALLLEFLARQARRLAALIAGQPRRTRWRLAAVALAAWLLLLGAELWVRAVDPQEVNGWGERASLQPHPTFGWQLIPDRTTQLRWRSYDYTVEANALGFPGPLYPAERTPGALRIVTLGDAFTSAEGVDTAQAWPRLLEAELAKRLDGRPVEVQNFGITGYGPNQHVVVADAVVPAFRPDLLLVALFVNEFEDVATTQEMFRRSIGFNRTPSESLYATLTLGQLATLASNAGTRLVYQRILGKPDPADVNFTQLDAFRARSGPDRPENRALMRDRLAQLRRIADGSGARLLLLLVPANIQVCEKDALAVYPRNVDLADPARFDLQRPQRVLGELASTLGITAIDLQPVLAEAGRCLYQPRNMHWLPEAHERIAAYLAGELIRTEAQPASAAVAK